MCYPSVIRFTTHSIHGVVLCIHPVASRIFASLFPHHRPRLQGQVLGFSNMITIASLLNPSPSSLEPHRDYSIPNSTGDTPELSSLVSPRKKQKLSKDAAIFVKGKPRGEVRYKPDEDQDEEIAAEHKRFQVYPMGEISKYCRHIPYNSEKKSFLEKTGRESFECSISSPSPPVL